MNTNKTLDQESIFSVYDADNQRLGTFSALPKSVAYADRVRSVMHEYISDQYEIYQHWPDGTSEHYATVSVQRLAGLGAVVKEELK